MSLAGLGKALERWGVPLVLALVFFVPALWIPRDMDALYRVGPEVAGLIGAWVIVALVGTGRALVGEPALVVPRGTWSGWALAAFGVWSIASSLLPSSGPKAWAYGATLVSYLLAGAAFLAWLDGRDVGRREAIFWVFFIVVGFETAIGVLQSIQFRPFPFYDPVKMPGYWDGYFSNLGFMANSNPVTDGTFGNRNYLAEWLGLLLPVLLGWQLSRERVSRWVLGVLAVALLVTFATSCRSVILGWGVAAPLAAALAFGLDRERIRGWFATKEGRRLAGGAAVLVVVGLATAGQNLVSRLAAIRVGSGGITVGDFAARLPAYRVAVDMWRHHVVLGNGLGSFKVQYPTVLQQEYPNGGTPTEATMYRFFQTHSEPLQGLAELGLVGLVLGIVAVVTWLRDVTINPTLPAAQRFGLIWGVITVIICSLLDFPLHIAQTILSLLIVVAMGLARSQVAEEAPASPARLGAAAWVYSAVTLLAVSTVGSLVVMWVGLPLVRGVEHTAIGRYALAAHDYATASTIFELAAGEDRFPVDPLIGLVQATWNSQQFEKVISLVEAHRGEGAGMTAELYRADALEKLGRRDEAIAAYKMVANYYAADHTSHKDAEEHLQRLLEAGGAKP